MPVQHSSPSDLFEVSTSGNGNGAKGAAVNRAGQVLRFAIFLLLILFAILLPHSIKGAQDTWRLAFLLWLMKLAIERKQPHDQPLTLPLLVYVVGSGISTVLSPYPYLSWDRMKIVCLVLVGTLFAQNLQRLKQIRVLVTLLILSGVVAAGFTAWQYTYGLGLGVAFIVPQSPLYHANIHLDDIITKVDGQVVRNELQFRSIAEQKPSGSMLRIEYLRGFPLHKWETFLTRDELIASLGASNVQFARGKPFRAQGTLGHYVVFAEVLMQVACMAWALLLSSDGKRSRWRAAIALVFVALTIALFLTETRAALGGLSAGCFVVLLVLSGKRSRIWATAALAGVLIASAFWIHHTRGAQWLGTNDLGTSFRIMMWHDAPRVIEQHPWFGLGMEAIRVEWEELHIRAYPFFHYQSHFHSDMIQVAVERGLITLAGWLWFVTAYFVFLIRLIAKAAQRSRFATGVVAGVLGSFVAYQITALVHYNLGLESVAMVLFFYFGLAVAIERMLREPEAIDVR